MTASAIPYNYFSEKTLSHLKTQKILSERYQCRTINVTLACKLIHAYGEYRMVTLSRKPAMSKERTTPRNQLYS